MEGNRILLEDTPASTATHASIHAPKKAARFYRPELDVLRLVAFFTVFMCHALPFDDAKHANSGRAWQALQTFREAGNFGVCLFFLLSSYLITELLRREVLETRSVHLQAFYVRRSLRIWPLYFTVLLAVACLGLFWPALRMPIPQFLAYLLFAGNWYDIFGAATHNPLSWLWSISVEEQFYVIWPSMAKLGGLRAIKIGSLVCLPLALIAIALVDRFQTHPNVAVWLNGVVQFQFFAWGALLAILLAGRIPSFSSATRAAMLAGGAVSWLTASGVCHLKKANFDPGSLRLCIGYELVAVGCVCFFLAALGASVAKLPQFCVYLGKVSYGLYVFHELALTAATAVRQQIEQSLALGGRATSLLFVADRTLGLLFTILAASLSYKFLETPFLKLKNKFTFVGSRPV